LCTKNREARKEESIDLRIRDLIDDAWRGQVEDSSAASESAENGGVVEELDLEETETRLCSF
jgi:hypothetical protein